MQKFAFVPATEMLYSSLDFITTLSSCLEIICGQQPNDFNTKAHQTHKTGRTIHLNPLSWKKNKDKEKVVKLKLPWGTRKLWVGEFYKTTYYAIQLKKREQLP